MPIIYYTDGMHHIDHFQMKDNKWLIAVDGHFMMEQNYLLWKAKRFMRRPFYSSYKLSRNLKVTYFTIIHSFS